MIRGRVPGQAAMGARGAVRRSSTSGGHLGRGTSAGGSPRDRRSTRSNQHQPPARVSAPGGRAGSVMGMGRQ
jgi:hypothetical protein